MLSLTLRLKGRGLKADVQRNSQAPLLELDRTLRIPDGLGWEGGEVPGETVPEMGQREGDKSEALRALLSQDDEGSKTHLKWSMKQK